MIATMAQQAGDHEAQNGLNKSDWMKQSIGRIPDWLQPSGDERLLAFLLPQRRRAQYPKRLRSMTQQRNGWNSIQQ
jgi:hypothetical protein